MSNNTTKVVKLILDNDKLSYKTDSFDERLELWQKAMPQLTIFSMPLKNVFNSKKFIEFYRNNY